MPTLLIVQVGLGRAIRETNITGTVSEFEGRSRPAVLDTLMSSMQGDMTSIVFRPHLVDEEAQAAAQDNADTVFTKITSDRHNPTQ